MVHAIPSDYPAKYGIKRKAYKKNKEKKIKKAFFHTKYEKDSILAYNVRTSLSVFPTYPYTKGEHVHFLFSANIEYDDSGQIFREKSVYLEDLPLLCYIITN